MSRPNDLQNDKSSSYKLRILAEDGGFPPLTTMAVLTINVNRNSRAPFFSHGNIIQRIQENTKPGQIIVDVNATDPDVPVSSQSFSSFYLFISNFITVILILLTPCQWSL